MPCARPRRTSLPFTAATNEWSAVGEIPILSARSAGRQIPAVAALTVPAHSGESVRQSGMSVSKRAWALSLGLLLPSCGGGGSSTPTPVASPSATPAACSQTILFQGNGVVSAGGAAGQEFTVPATADTRIDVAVDWSSPS